MSLQKHTPRTMSTKEHAALVQKHTQAFYDVLAAAALDGVELQTLKLQEASGDSLSDLSIEPLLWARKPSSANDLINPDVQLMLEKEFTQPVDNDSNTHVLTHGVPILKHTPLGLYSNAINSVVTYKTTPVEVEGASDKNFKNKITILIPGEHPDIELADEEDFQSFPIVNQSIDFSPK